jgi:hypothetical protein
MRHALTRYGSTRTSTRHGHRPRPIRSTTACRRGMRANPARSIAVIRPEP